MQLLAIGNMEIINCDSLQNFKSTLLTDIKLIQSMHQIWIILISWFLDSQTRVQPENSLEYRSE